MTNSNTPPRNLLRSTGAMLAGFIAVFVLSLGTDQILHALDIYPPWEQPMTDTGLLLLALSYRRLRHRWRLHRRQTCAPSSDASRPDHWRHWFRTEYGRRHRDVGQGCALVPHRFGPQFRTLLMGRSGTVHKCRIQA